MPPLSRAAARSCLLWVLFAALPSLAASTAVFPPQATNLEPGPALALGQLLANEYARASGQPVVLPAQAGAALQPGMSVAAAASALNVDEYLETSAIGLDRGLLVTTTRYRRDGAPLYSAQMRAQGLDDLPEVAARLARALYQQVPPEQTRTLDTITAREAREPQRVASETVGGFRTFASRPLGATFEPLTGLGIDLRFESGRRFLEFGVGFIAPVDNSPSRIGYGGLYGELGGGYYLSDGDTAPYVGAGVTPRLLFGDSLQSPANLGLWGQAGVMFMRTTSTRLYAELRLTQNLFALSRQEFEAVDAVEYYPTELGVQVGIGW